MNTQVGFSFGSNVGDKSLAVEQALKLLDEHSSVTLTAISSLYKSEPWGVTDQDWFINACAIGNTTLSPHDLLAACKEIEQKLGRKTSIRWGPRRIDIDILFYGEQEINDPDLVIPHAQILARSFVLKPLFEVSPELKIGALPIEDALKAVANDAKGVIKLERVD